jgi:hypothetical protein
VYFHESIQFRTPQQEQLVSGMLCYLSTEQKQVKSSRLFLGHIHEMNKKRLSGHFKVSEKAGNYSFTINK